MSTLETLLKNLFADKAITDTRIDGFAIVILPKITAASDSGQYKAIAKAIQVAQVSFHANIVALSSDTASGKGKRITREQSIADFLDFVRLEEGTVRKVYVKDEESFLEFYPDKLKDYNKINKTTATILMQRYSDAATEHSGDFDPDFVDTANAFPVDYSTAIDAQSAVSGNKNTDRTGRNSYRIALNDALYQALHFITYYTSGDMDILKGIFDLSTLVPHKRTTIVHLNGLITNMATINLDSENYDITYVVKIRNIGVTDLNIGLEATADTPCSNTDGIVKTGKTKTFVIVSLGAIGNKFLNLTNLDLNNNGSYEVEIYRQ